MTSDTRNSELDDYLAAHPETRYLETLSPDMNGILRGKRAERHDFHKLFGNGMNLCAATVVLDSRGHTFESIPLGGRDGDPDVRAFAVPGSLAPVPWVSVPTAQALVEMHHFDGTLYPNDPRNVLRRALQPLRDMGLKPVMATELEFYLVEHDGERFQPRLPRIPGSDRPQPGPQYGIMEDLYEIDDFLADLDAICMAQDIPAGAALSEFSAGQFEVNLHHVDDPVLACDHAVLLKRAVKAAASRNGLGATFMAKPFAESAGSGLHLHISLLDADGNNVFAGQSRDGAFSDRLRNAVGGLAATMKESMAIFAPNGNSYRRHAAGRFVPASPSWGTNHRSVAMRIPLAAPANTRIEHRIAGADANPYLVVAAVMAGIHHGISGKCEPPPVTPEGTELDYQVTVPIRWPQALDAFDAGTLLPQYLGEAYHRLFGVCRREEEANYTAEVPTKDFDWYLRAV
ncbi:MAG: glutamine synthetase family protein [Xanthomonadales bacterium]|jgi:glutamine synthetase|nr:glutamine synthetase family protein [Xanthomonadales bacterium]